MSRHTVRRTDDYYCDIPMAIAKGIIGDKKTNLPKCAKDCLSCIACIRIERGVARSHVDRR